MNTKHILYFLALLISGSAFGQIILPGGDGDKPTYYRDADGDGYGNNDLSSLDTKLIATPGYVLDHSDCNDSNASVFPGATEICDGIDNDCDGAIDENKPSIPSLATVTNNCGNSVLTRGNPPSGITWYWQSSTSGTSTSNTSSSITRTSGSTYYLRAKNNSTGCWSTARSVSYSIQTAPSAPAISNISVVNNCGSSKLTRGAVISVYTWYWQSSPTGTSTSLSSATITKTTGSKYYIRARDNGSGCWSTATTVNYSIKSAPSTPPTPNVTNNCGNSILTRSNPPSGITWYWQSTSGGTSTANSNTSITRTSGSTYYLRARNNSTGCWSNARTVSYSIKSIPSTPSAASVFNNCGSSILTRSNPPTGITWYWQSSPTGTSTANSNTSITRTSGSKYYLRARNNSTLCWSAARTISYNITSVPTTPTAPTVVNNCGNSVLTRTTPSSGITWYWQSSASGTSTINSASSITRTSGSTYYLRARNNITSCWSVARTISYSIKVVPTTPAAPTVVNNCGNSILTRTTPPSGTTWYWQGSSGGTSTANSASSITRTSGSAYYLRARNNTSGCWSTAKTVNYSVKITPPVPSTNSITIVNNCGSSILTRDPVLSAYTWYWQNSPTGTSTFNASASITRTSGSTYYIRAKDNSTGCWSASRTINYTIKTAPATPTTPTVVNDCGGSILTRSTPPSGITWYWQSSTSGTNTANSNTSITRTSGSVYYLRAKNNTTGCWSIAKSVNYSIKSIPSTPSAASVFNNCGSSILTRSNPPTGVTWYWQSNASGTNTANSASSITRTSGSKYYLRARNNSTLCWSSAKTISYNISAVPTAPTAPTVVNNCGNSVLTRTTPPSGVTWYWQSSASGTNTTNSASSITRTSGSNYYLRARNNITLCWSPARTVSYSIKSVPSMPAVANVVNNCGNSVLTRSNPPSGVTWYWQSIVEGTSTSNSTSSITRTSGSTYYLRARNNSSLCWSPVRTVDYIIKTTPPVPTAPTITNNCGSTILTREAVLSAYTWYWQSNATGTSTANSSPSVTRTSGSTYYIRARNNNTECWSNAREINYSVTLMIDWYLDADNDGYAVSKINQCDNPGAGYVQQQLPLGDCDDSNPNIQAQIIWYADADNDGYGNPNVTISQCTKPIGYVSNNTDCLDTDILINPDTIWYADIDNDGFGDANDSITQCIQPQGYVSNSNDQCVLEPGPNLGCTVAPYQNVMLSDNENYIYTRTYQRAMISQDSILFNTDVIENITYFDGLGRAKQQIGIKQSPNLGDIVSHIAYDQYGRQAKNHLPFVSNELPGSYKAVDINTDINTYYQNKYPADFIGITKPDAINAFSESIFEASPQNRVLEQAAPGKSWKFDSKNIEYVNPQYVPMPSSYYGYTSKQWNANFFFDPEQGQPEIENNEEIRGDRVLTRIDHDNILTFEVIGSPFSLPLQPSNEAHPLQLGTIDYIRIIPEIKYLDLGNLVDSDGNPTSYRLELVNNNFVLSSDTEVLQEIVRLNTSITIDLNQPILEGYDDKISLNHTIKFDYQTNLENEVIDFDVQGSGTNVSLVKEGYYTANVLYKSITKDENWQPTDNYNHTTEEFKNKQGQVVLKRTYNNNIAHDTYYVYDGFGNLTYVIPPKVTLSETDGVSTNELSQLCYQYKYDDRNRLIEKKIPGKGWEYIVYNKLDQPVLTMDANRQRANTGLNWDTWLFTKYDAFGRVAYTGKNIDGSTIPVIRSRYNNATTHFEKRIETPYNISGVQLYYSKEVRPTSGMTIYTVNYYDDYNFLDTNLASQFIRPEIVLGQTTTTNVKGLATGTKVRVLGTNNWITTVTYYDKKARPIYVVSVNEYLNTVDIIETKLDFVGKVLETKTSHIKGNNTPIVTIDNFTYDHVGRLLDQKQTINGQTIETIATNTYDELGQLESKAVGANLQEVDYAYNVRGWLTTINEGVTNNGDLFGFKINYNTTNENSGATALYNGNISQTSWSTASENTNNNPISNTYTYAYDALNRITSGIDNTGHYNLTNVAYDKNGNITNLTRNGHINASASNFGVMDNLTYTYNNNGIGNQLLQVEDIANKNEGFKDGNTIGNDYEYDANGNMTIDRNKNITEITYNHLNLPHVVTVNDENQIFYTYDATGVKLRKEVVDDTAEIVTITEYASNYIYKNDELEFIHQPEGYIEPEIANGSEAISSFNYVYQYKDHLGNIRLSYTDANKDGAIVQSEIIEEKNYYPFGLQHKGYNNTITGRKHNYGYGSKEEQSELGLGWIDITARNYDPALGRWMNIDPLAEQMRRHSPYNYAFNNPIYFQDPDGMMPCPNGDCPDEYEINKKVEFSSGSMIKPEINGGRYGSGIKKRSLKNNRAVQINTSNTNRSEIGSPLHQIANKFTGIKTESDTANRETTVQTGQFFDKEGNKVSAKDNKTGTFVLTTTKVTESIELNTDLDLDSTVNVTTEITTQNFSVYRGNYSLYAIFDKGSSTESYSENTTLSESSNEFVSHTINSVKENGFARGNNIRLNTQKQQKLQEALQEAIYNNTQ